MGVLRKAVILGLASTIQGLAMAVFLFPHFIPSGGAASVSVLLNYLLHVPFADTLWVMNACLLGAAIKWLGKGNAFWTMYCVTVTSVVVDAADPLMTGTVSFVFVDLLIGSILFGIGVGVLFRMGASSGGMDILALIISKLKGYSPGKTLFAINGSVLLLTGIVVDLKIILFAIACQFIATRILDIINKFDIRRSIPHVENV
ncbi:YitT family protein [Rossellomorea vietnamensis]|uniref:YitT family protein n=1 Tax=Rossellomorea vietnamensis TaxID=218284 RepID=A0ACD4C9Q6_9BACI|nr:YitT family protein [Rossellomorea vietnamensis]UXH45233.1 YitT family protein [Rossellomorea vietnamensis]